MKNRLQFNRIPFLYSSGETLVSGTSVGLSGRETALSGLTWFTTRRNFIPLIGEPIVVRYIDDKGKKQLMLAIGKATGSTADDTYGIEYHVIDSAKLQEDIDLANEHAAEALELASGATKDTADYLTILKNMILSGIGLTDGSYFDNNGRWDRDPSHVGLYDPIENANYIGEAASFREADDMLDKAIKEQADNLETLSGVTVATVQSLNDLWEATGEFSAATVEFSASTVAELTAIKSDVEELSGVTEEFSAATKGYLDRILQGTGLNTQEPGEYPGHDETHIIKDATSLDNADVLLDAAIWNLSADTYNTIAELSAGTLQLSADTDAAINELSANTDATIHELSAGTVSGLEYLSGVSDTIIEAAGLNADGTYPHTHNANFIDKASSLNDADVILDTKLAELSANTMAADQALQDQIDELDNRKVLGISAITVETLENGDSKVSLLINEEDDKVLTQNTLGLKANLSLVYNRDDKKIYLKGKNGVISEIDANDFIKDGMLSAASVFTATEADHEQYPELVVGKTYIKLLFNTDAEEPGRANPVFISAEDLVDIYTVAPESYTYMTINDYVISLNVDQENGLASYNYARNISAVTTNIIEAAGLNMGEQGSYPGHDETHYIKNATSLDNADVLLDAAIWETSGLVSDINDRLVDLSGVTESFSAHTVEALSGLSSSVYELSAVTESFSAHTVEALSALSSSIDERIESALTIYSGIVQEYVEEALSGLNFDEIYEYVDNSVESLSGAVLDYIADVEEVTAAALNELNGRVSEVETHMTGEYIPLTGYEEITGSTEEELIVDEDDTVNEAFGKLQKQILDNEEVIAAGFNDLKNRIDEVAEEAGHSTGVTVLSGVVRSFSSHTVNEFNEVHNDIDELSGVVQSISAKTSGVLTINLNGVEQGVYCPSASTTVNLEAIQEVTGADVLLTGYEISTGSTEEELVVLPTDTVNEAFGKIQKQIYDNESVVAGALNDLNDRVNELSSGVSEDIAALSASVVNNRTDINILSATIIDNEYVIAAALNDLNDRIMEVSGQTVDLSNYYTKDEVYNKTEVYNKAEVDAKIASGGTFDPTQYYTTANTYNKTEIDNHFNEITSAFSGIVNDLEDEISDKELVIAAAFNDLRNKIDEVSGRTVDLSDYYTKEEVDVKIAGGGADALTGITMNGSPVSVTNNVANLGNVLTSFTETQLSSAVTGTGNVFSSIQVSNHKITMGKDISAATVEQLQVLSGALETLSASTVETLTNITSAMDLNEIVVAAALNDLNSRILELQSELRLAQTQLETVMSDEWFFNKLKGMLGEGNQIEITESDGKLIIGYSN